MTEEKKLVPKRRFKEFQNNQSWGQSKLGGLTDIVRGASPRPIQDPKWFDDKSEVGWLRIADVTEQDGRIHYLEQRISKAGQDKTRVLTEPHLLLSIAATVGKPVVNYVKTGVHDGFLIFQNPKFDREFMFQYLEMFRPKWYQYGQPGSQVNLNSELVKNHEIMLPSVDEQKKTGEFFAKLDSLINLQQRKLEKANSLKSAYLSELFPVEGETEPKRRIAGFTQDWKQYKLGELLELRNGYAFKSKYFSNSPTKEIVLTPGNVNIGGGFQYGKGHYYDVAGVFPHNFIMQSGDIFVTMTDLTPTAQTLGSPAFVPNDGNVYLHNQRIGKLINYDGNTNFLFYLLCTEQYRKQIISTASGTTVKHSSPQKILDCLVSIPSIEEQEKIGTFFNKIEHIIDLHQSKLEKLQNLKKAYLNEMFI